MFIDSPQGRIFVIHRTPHAFKAHSGVVLVPPFAEEMNQCRRMLTLLAEALAASGYHVVLPDFYGTGDSEGEFVEASWRGWLEQLNCTVATVQNDYGIDRYSLLGVRAGTLLVADYLQKSRSKPDKLVLWQPVVDGAVYLKQFLRLRLASDMLAGSKEEDSHSMMQLLSAGEVVEVAGYALTSAVADGLSSSSLKNIEPDSLPATCWIDLVASEGLLPPLPHRNLTETWREANVAMQHQIVIGEPFWNSVGIVENHDVVAKTVNFLKGDEPHGA